MKLVRGESELANDPIFSPDALEREKGKTVGGYQSRSGRIFRPHNRGSNRPSASSFTTSTTRSRSAPNRSTPSHSPAVSSKSPINQSEQSSCPMCNCQLALTKCSKFLKSSVKERDEIIRNKGLCYGCFEKGHLSADCPNRFTCEECRGRHHTLMHRGRPMSSDNPQSDFRLQASQQSSSSRETPSESQPVVRESANSNATNVAHNSVADSASIITNCRIVQVVLFHKDNRDKKVKVYALLDGASDTTFVTTQVQHELGIEGVETSLLGRKTLSVRRVEGLTVQRLDKRAQVELPKAYARRSIPSRRDQIPTTEIVDK